MSRRQAWVLHGHDATRRAVCVNQDHLDEGGLQAESRTGLRYRRTEDIANADSGPGAQIEEHAGPEALDEPVIGEPQDRGGDVALNGNRIDPREGRMVGKNRHF